MKLKPELYMAMLDTAEVVAKRYNVSREAQDVYSLESQRRTAAAQESGKFDAEIIAVTCQKAITNKDTGAVTFEEVTLRKDEGNRADTTHRGAAQAQARSREGRDHGGQREPALRRRERVRDHGAKGRRAAGRDARSAFIEGWRSPAVSRTRWASARSSRSPSSSSGTG